MPNINEGMTIGKADENFDETLDRMSCLNIVIRNLKMRDTINIMDVAEIDERLVKEIANYDALTAEMKRDIILLLVDDAVRLQEACFKNYGNLGRAIRSLGKIEELLDKLRHDDGLRDSKAFRELKKEAKTRLSCIKGNLIGKTVEIKEQKNQAALQSKMRRYAG
ncbi:hypothetical protein KY347_06805 [Candidatus Woesearchaeota archaeon]|nr:hypothetical protein [Candidatus Woesearchaeota archaeon]